MTDAAQGDEIEGLRVLVRRACIDEINGRASGDIIVKGCTAAEYVNPESAAEAFVDEIAQAVHAHYAAELASLRRAISDHQDLSRKVAASLQGQLAAESQRCGRWEARALLAESKLAEAKGALDESYATLAAAFNRIHCLPRTTDTELAQRIGQTCAKIESARAALSHLETQETCHDRHG